MKPPFIRLVADGCAPELRLGPADIREAGANEFTSAFENAAIGMALVAPDSRYLRVNKAFCTMLGYTEAEMLSRSVHQITHPDDLDEDLRERACCLAGEKETYHREKRYLHRDGHVVWGHLTCTLVRDARGRPLHFISQVQDVTERKAAEIALRESEARFRSLAMLSSHWYWEQDEYFRFTSFLGPDPGDAWRREQARVLGRRRWELAGLYPLHGTWAEHRAVMEAHQPFHNFHYMRVAHDGSAPRYLCTSGEPVFNADGKFCGYRGTALDITVAKVAEQRLRDTQAMLHMAAQIGRLGAWAYNVGDPTLTWSAEVCAIHDVMPGFSPTSEKGCDFFAPGYRETMRRTIGSCLRDGSPFDVEAQIITAKGRLVWVRVIGEAEWDANGQVRRIQGACQDISEAKRAAEEAQLMADQLTVTLESLTDAFFTVDRDWRFTYVNAQAEQTLGRSRAELIGLDMWKAFPDQRHSEFGRNYQRAMSDNVVVQFEAYFEPFGSWVQVKAYPSRQGLAIYTKDVTERVQAQQEILRLNAQLEERVRERTAQLEDANKELESFSYSIAHDLRAPLSSINGFSQMLEQAAAETGLPHRCKHYLSRIRAGVKQMGELTDGLLSLSNLSRTQLRDEPVDLAVFARATTAICREGAPEREAQVRIEASLPARGDPRLLAQVIGNLVANAWKFTARKQCAQIEVGRLPGTNMFPVYFVRDNGAGFDMRYASRMFEAFQRLHGAADFEGTGIGLAIVHKVVTRHGGRIWAEAVPEQGACFYFTLGHKTD